MTAQARDKAEEANIRTGGGDLVRELNRFHVLTCVRRFEPISRTEIVDRTGLSRGTVSGIVAELIEEGLANESPADSRGEGGRGRPRLLLRMNPNAAFVVGVKISLHQLSIMVTNLRADPLASVILPIPPTTRGAEAIATMIDRGVRSAVAEAGLAMTDIHGVGVGVPGFIDSRAGVSRWSPILGDEPVAFAQMLQARLGRPTVIQNDANMVAMAERWFGHGQDDDDFAVVTLEAGVGLGIYMRGELQQGAHGLASEFGHIKLAIDEGPMCGCGQTGCLAAFVSGFALLRDARGHVDAPEPLNGPQIDREVRRLAELARGGHAGLRGVFQRAGHALGVGVANLVNLLDPAKVVISGATIHAADLLAPAMRESFAANAIRGAPEHCEILVREWGDDIWARGAAAQILEHVYRAPSLRSPLIPPP